MVQRGEPSHCLMILLMLGLPGRFCKSYFRGLITPCSGNNKVYSCCGDSHSMTYCLYVSRTVARVPLYWRYNLHSPRWAKIKGLESYTLCLQSNSLIRKGEQKWGRVWCRRCLFSVAYEGSRSQGDGFNLYSARKWAPRKTPVPPGSPEWSKTAFILKVFYILS